MTRSIRSISLLLLAAAVALPLAGGGCIFNPEPDKIIPPEKPHIPPPTVPQNLIAAIEVLYNDKVRNASERKAEYENLLAQDFIFRFQPADYDQVGRESWGAPDEIAAHERIFGAQDSHQIFSLELNVEHLPPTDINPPQEGREGWKYIFATNVYLRLMENPNDGFEVNGGQADFYFEPATNGSRWYIGEWDDLPRP